MVKVSLPLVSASGGHLLIPAEEVITLLRRVTADWVDTAEQDGSSLDPRTVTVLATILVDLADQLDVECIALASEESGENGDGPVPDG
ncbi:DUF6213 family protein [Kitasatospora sp. NPDC004240]